MPRTRSCARASSRRWPKPWPFAKAEGLPLEALIDTARQGRRLELVLRAPRTQYDAQRPTRPVFPRAPAREDLRHLPRHGRAPRRAAARGRDDAAALQTLIEPGPWRRRHLDDLPPEGRGCSRPPRRASAANTADDEPRAAPALAADGRGFFLPDFLRARAVLAIVLSIAGTCWPSSWRSRARPCTARSGSTLRAPPPTCLWTGLSCAAVLCKARPWLAGKPAADGRTGRARADAGTVTVVSDSCTGRARHGGPDRGALAALPAAALVVPAAERAHHAIVGALALRYFYVANEWRRSVELEPARASAPCRRACRPHFLFNQHEHPYGRSPRSDPARAEEAIEDLADLFRVTLSDARRQISLREELEVRASTNAWSSCAWASGLQVRWKVAELPPDAIVAEPAAAAACWKTPSGHAIEPLPEGGTVTVEGRRDGDAVVIAISNPVSATAKAVRNGNRMALDKIRRASEPRLPRPRVRSPWIRRRRAVPGHPALPALLIRPALRTRPW